MVYFKGTLIRPTYKNNLMKESNLLEEQEQKFKNVPRLYF